MLVVKMYEKIFRIVGACAIAAVVVLAVVGAVRHGGESAYETAMRDTYRERVDGAAGDLAERGAVDAERDAADLDLRVQLAGAQRLVAELQAECRGVGSSAGGGESGNSQIISELDRRIRDLGGSGEAAE